VSVRTVSACITVKFPPRDVLGTKQTLSMSAYLQCSYLVLHNSPGQGAGTLKPGACKVNVTDLEFFRNIQGKAGPVGI
jgi:hypothetical protein